MEVDLQVDIFPKSVRLVCEECAYVLQDLDGAVIQLTIHFRSVVVKDVRQWLRQDISYCPTCGMKYYPYRVFESIEQAKIIRKYAHEEIIDNVRTLQDLSFS